MAAERGLAMATCTAPVNIAVIKYWGKRDTDLILPINSSLSVTLHQDQLRTTTTAAASRDFTEDRLWLNGKEVDVGHPRVQACLREVSALARLYGLEEELSEVARRGSGSACRSMFGGFVQWQRGERPDGTDSLALQVAPETHWPELRVLVLVVSGEKKPVGSTAGMQTSVETSPLLKHRAEVVVPERLAQMMQHIQERDFEGFGQLAMRDSNQFHATCLDTFPPIFYLTDVSRHIIALVHRYNAHHGHTKVAYTFDAGPNAVIFALADAVAEFVEVVRRSFPPAANGDQFVRGLPVGSAALPQELLAAVLAEPLPGAVRYILHTKPGPGPQLVDDPSQHLLGADGLPRSRA
ncbi:diphosphomevalonate decarboxylase isoform X2 [Taeniopygia guttata]|uniref:diphosphomevalonate decarboxylase isoform X2 n=1 Tax=Taeniopygia guttata TaxID=59729 RepID=UPI003BB95FA1